MQRSLELVFSQEGILAFTNCCSNCTDSYADCSDSTFSHREREQGIAFFKFFLSGGNYISWGVSTAYVAYTDLDYLLQNWEDECDIIRRWCAVLEVKDYEVEKPKSEQECIVVRFKQPVDLEFYSETDEEEEEEEEDFDRASDDEEHTHIKN